MRPKNIVIGPHVVVKTDKTSRYHLNGEFKGEYHVYECKYCGASSVSLSSVTWRANECNEFAWTKSEKVAHRNNEQLKI